MKEKGKSYLDEVNRSAKKAGGVLEIGIPSAVIAVVVSLVLWLVIGNG